MTSELCDSGEEPRKAYLQAQKQMNTPDEEEFETCDMCNGKGKVLTLDGGKLICFIREWL
ncbi:hypothetical protein QCI77_28380 [Bacillus cereus group sp. MG9]|uniref:hypothetical protein n=1 Tax=Bacillus cereus group sp. MG9 TaxID=3040247 RepID=UPI003392FD57